MLIGEITWVCWKERTARVFLNKQKSVVAIASEGLQLFNSWSNLCNSNLLGEHGTVWHKISKLIEVLNTNVQSLLVQCCLYHVKMEGYQGFHQDGNVIIRVVFS